ncbi:hypothetical protein [Natronoglycomyces albus]|uniref:Uncharacterized protein n=1 Tax=Natronoglycomyces albus TaxID=2811108 RepID=A0A895XL19_9ACTN|nr:hypothetical protein [Natronoglycomyces albus]QSB04119.1 hypothetical protein JQS30_09860 [Natronoglycomyces albus]
MPQLSMSPYVTLSALLALLSVVSLLCAWIAMRRRVRADEEWAQANPDYVLPAYKWETRKIWMRRGYEANRRFTRRAGPAIVVYFSVFSLLGAWLTAALMFLTLAPPAQDDVTIGEVLDVHQCAKPWYWTSGAYACSVSVDWEDPEIQNDQTVTVHSLESMSTSSEATLASNGTWVIPAQRLQAASSWWAIAPIFLVGAWGIVLGSLHFPHHSHIRRVRDWPTY